MFLAKISSKMSLRSKISGKRHVSTNLTGTRMPRGIRPVCVTKTALLIQRRCV